MGIELNALRFQRLCGSWKQLVSAYTLHPSVLSLRKVRSVSADPVTAATEDKMQALHDQRLLMPENWRPSAD